MSGPLRSLARGRAVLFVVAAPVEAAAVRAAFAADPPPPGERQPMDWPLEILRPGVELLITGVGKVNAAAAIAHRADPSRHGLVVNLGICGALKPLSELALRSVVLAGTSVYADEGVATPSGFQSLPEMGFPLGPFAGPGVDGDPALLDILRPLAQAIGPIATVSTCSGTDALAREVAGRTGAIAEGMEGAAIAHTLVRLHPEIPFAELRVVSNSTGDRPGQHWDLRGSLARLTGLVEEMLT
jgi:futalosine hydrolase